MIEYDCCCVIFLFFLKMTQIYLPAGLPGRNFSPGGPAGTNEYTIIMVCVPNLIWGLGGRKWLIWV
jgi:hypothetical protein